MPIREPKIDNGVCGEIYTGNLAVLLVAFPPLNLSSVGSPVNLMASRGFNVGNSAPGGSLSPVLFFAVLVPAGEWRRRGRKRRRRNNRRAALTPGCP